MHVSFSKLPDDARIWIYQANRPFTEDELPEIKKRTTAFLTQWTAHQQALEAGFEVPYSRFLVIGLNQKTVAASGCSIDASVRFIQTLEQDFSLILRRNRAQPRPQSSRSAPMYRRRGRI